MIKDEKNGLWYEKKGDYYIPCIMIFEEQDLIGIWGQRHLKYLKEHRGSVYTALLITGKLNSYLVEINRQAEEMYYRLVKEIAEKENVTEKLKTKNQMLWVQKMNNIHNTATEIVNNELIYR